MEKWEQKAVLDLHIENSLIDLYTTLAGTTRGYISVVQRDFGYSKEMAQKEMLKLDESARKRVAEAYHIYDESLGDDKK